MINVYNTEHERILSIFTKMEITFIYGNYNCKLFYFHMCFVCVCGTVSWNPARLALTYYVVDNNPELLTFLLSLPKRKSI